tara:strand:- start:1181 stop:1795 length:615 start_codon:yes stop_codon:yes gene_type:complete
MQVCIIDYGMGNINSITNALNYLGITWNISNSRKDIENFSHLILPGVGSYKVAMNNLNKLDLVDGIKELGLIKKKKILGICLGMQLLGSSSTEDGYTKGLEFVNNKVTKFSSTDKEFRVPHVGFNNISKFSEDFYLFKNINSKDNFYFVHSYKMDLEKNSNYVLCNYGNEFLAGFQKENIFGVQFHPEKSQSSGLKVLNNFFNY